MIVESTRRRRVSPNDGSQTDVRAITAASKLRHGPVPRPATARGFQWPYAISFSAVHLLALLALFPYFFSWWGVGAFIFGFYLFGFAIILGYHRLLAHNSFAVPKWLERFMAILAICSMQDTPVRWVTAHRMHHKYSDEQQDPHTPHAGWFWGHVGWLCVRNSATRGSFPYGAYAHDLLKDPFYRRLEQSFMLVFVIFIAQVYLYLGVGFAIGWFATGTFAGAIQMALSVLVWGVALRTVATWHTTWGVNSLVHRYGYKNYDTPDDSRNSWIASIFASGEGWHNNHHHDQASASNRHKWWELDLSFAVVWCLERAGLATNVVRPRVERHAARHRN